MKATFEQKGKMVYYFITRDNGNTVAGAKLSSLTFTPSPLTSNDGEPYGAFRKRVLAATQGRQA